MLAGSNGEKKESDLRVKRRRRERSSQLGSFAVVCCAPGVNKHRGQAGTVTWQQPGSATRYMTSTKEAVFILYLL